MSETPQLFPICRVCHEPRSFTHLHSCCATAIKMDGTKCPVCDQDLLIVELIIDQLHNPARRN